MSRGVCLRVLRQEFGDRRDDCVLLFPREFRVDRDADAFRRETLAYRQRWIRPEMRETLLQVHGAGIVDFRSDLVGSEMLLEGVTPIFGLLPIPPLRHAKRVLVPNMLVMAV